MKDLKNQLIILGKQKPELRKHLGPLIDAVSSEKTKSGALLPGLQRFEKDYHQLAKVVTSSSEGIDDYLYELEKVQKYLEGLQSLEVEENGFESPSLRKRRERLRDINVFLARAAAKLRSFSKDFKRDSPRDLLSSQNFHKKDF